LSPHMSLLFGLSSSVSPPLCLLCLSPFIFPLYCLSVSLLSLLQSFSSLF
jgi:hypothetical protein